MAQLTDLTRETFGRGHLGWRINDDGSFAVNTRLLYEILDRVSFTWRETEDPLEEVSMDVPLKHIYDFNPTLSPEVSTLMSSIELSLIQDYPDEIIQIIPLTYEPKRSGKGNVATIFDCDILVSTDRTGHAYDGFRTRIASIVKATIESCGYKVPESFTDAFRPFNLKWLKDPSNPDLQKYIDSLVNGVGNSNEKNIDLRAIHGLLPFILNNAITDEFLYHLRTDRDSEYFIGFILQAVSKEMRHMESSDPLSRANTSASTSTSGEPT